MATKQIGTLAVGSIVKLKFNGALKEFIIVHQGLPSSLYDSSCNGTWLLMKDCLETRQWHSSNVNDYANSAVHSYLNSTVFSKFDADIQAKIKQVKIPYRPGGGTSETVNSGANGLSANIFLLSDREVGGTKSNVSQYICNDGEKLSYFIEEGNTGGDGCQKRIAYYNGNAVTWWLRSPSLGQIEYAWRVYTDGKIYSNDCNYSRYYLRPALILPSNFQVVTLSDGSAVVNTAPSIPASISVPGSINGGSSITVSWGASTDAEGNLSGYKLELSTNGGSTWTQIYQGTARQTTHAVAFGTESVMYRVRAYDSEGLHSGYRTSGQVTVINNHAPSASPGITVPEDIKGGSTIVISWQTATDQDGDLSGYSLERQVDGGAWAEIYQGAETTYEDSITKGWQTIRYRVRAYDSHSAYGSYATSAAMDVDNNTAPLITCALSGDLGTKSEGFAIPYTVTDPDEGEVITVTESIDSAEQRTYTANSEEENHLDLTGEAFMKLLNGPHTVAISASDGKIAAVHGLTFTKSVTAASVTLKEPLRVDAPLTICVLSVTGSIPVDAEYTVEVTNNASDETPVWQDCTAAVKTGVNILFDNETAENGFAFNFRVRVKRGKSGKGGYITSIQGGFQ